ncbi:MAG: hypothetical protein K2Y32_08330 [Candidatus Obscuribacterales bacterium]|nr:hypothetical protein [Candidatus Obscuribacterales bacterium]
MKPLNKLIPSLAALLMLAPGAFAAEDSNEGEKVLQETAMLPVKVLAVSTALVVGPAISTVRKEGEIMGKYSKALAQETIRNDGPTPLMLASIPGQTLNVLGGLGTGLVTGVEKALGGFQHPFSEDSFSLAENQ